MEEISKGSKDNNSKSSTSNIKSVISKVFKWVSSKTENTGENQVNNTTIEHGLDPFVNYNLEEELLKEICESGNNLQDISLDDKSRLKQIFDPNSTRATSELNSTLRKTRKDFETRNSLKQSYNYRETLSASPVCKNRRCGENSSDSGDEMDQGIDDCDENIPEDNEDYSYDNSQNINENELDYDYQNDTAPTAPSNEEELNSPIETTEDIKKLGLKDLIYKLFLNIYNSEKENINKLKKEIFPRITEDTRLDDFITYAISNCMDHVKDELQSFIKKNLKCQRKKSEMPQKSMINDSTFVPFLGNEKLYNEVIDKIIDFYELFKCSIDNIVDVWKDKLGHIDRLHDIFDFRHKKLFGVNIWQDKEIIHVMKVYYNQSDEDDEYLKRVDELKIIDDELNESNLHSGKEVGSSKKNKKAQKTKNKNKSKNKKGKDGLNNSKGEKDVKLYEINDIDLLCSIIQDSNNAKAKAKPTNKKN